MTRHNDIQHLLTRTVDRTDPLLAATNTRRHVDSQPNLRLIFAVTVTALALAYAAVTHTTTANAATPAAAAVDAGDENTASEHAATNTPDSDATTNTANPYAPASCDWMLPTMDEHGLPRWMTAIAWRESRCTPDAHNNNPRTADNSYGLFQINAHTPQLRKELADTCNITNPEQLLNANTNIACAANLYHRYGYQPWNPGTYFTT